MDFDPRDYNGRDRDDDRVYGCWRDDPRDRDDRERDLDARERDPRDPFVESLDLPRGLEREVVIDERDREYELNGEDSRMLATIGAFRVVRERDLDEFHDAASTLDHLREEGLIHSVQIGPDDRADVLTDRGWDLLEVNRRERDDDGYDPRDDDRQAFHAGVARERELQHDADLFRAYLEVEDRLRDQGADIERVVLEVDLRREYQEWLQEHNRGRSDSDGRPDRTDREIEQWAREHELHFDEKVHFPDFRIEYELGGRDRHEDVEVTTAHYRGAHAASPRSLDPRTHLIALLGGEAGLRCGEMIALEWADVDLGNRQLCIRRSDWNGQVTTPKGGRLRHVPLTRRLTAALSEHRHLRSARVLCQDDTEPLTRQIVQTRAKRAASKAGLPHGGVHILRHYAGSRTMPSDGKFESESPEITPPNRNYGS